MAALAPAFEYAFQGAGQNEEQGMPQANDTKSSLDLHLVRQLLQFLSV
jgi:hypothetical protein